ncbi:hypothetical protein HispidOSU_027910 [Sigmodon hispidus]
MTPLHLVLWSSLVSMALARGLMTKAPALNLSCFQCFKVHLPSECQPILCQPDEKVCHSNEVFIYTNKKNKIQISKGCAVRCPNSNSVFEWTLTKGIQTRITRRCCSRNLCNRASDTQERFRGLSGRILLPMGLGLFCTML